MSHTPEQLDDLAHKVMMDYLTDGNPEGDFKHSTIGADSNKQWWIKGYIAGHKAEEIQAMREELERIKDARLNDATKHMEAIQLAYASINSMRTELLQLRADKARLIEYAKFIYKGVFASATEKEIVDRTFEILTEMGAEIE